MLAPNFLSELISLAHAATSFDPPRILATLARISSATASMAFAGAPLGFQCDSGLRARAHFLEGDVVRHGLAENEVAVGVVERPGVSLVDGRLAGTS